MQKQMKYNMGMIKTIPIEKNSREEHTVKGTYLTDQIIERFGLYLKREEKAPNTVEKYVRDGIAFSKYLQGRGINKEIAIEYKRHLQENGYAVRSINSVIASLNGLFAFMGLHHCKLKSIKLQRPIYCAEEQELTRAEYIRLLQTAGKMGNERLHLILQTICGTGIRVSELQSITVRAVRRGEAVVSLKGKTRTVFIVKALQTRLLRYIARHKITEGSVFVTRSGKPIDRISIWREMKGLCQSAKVDPQKVFPHNLRHLFARTFYKMEKDIAKLADILGHSNINTTRIYMISTGNEHRMRIENMRLIL